jgi:hypothetical protein
LFILKYFAAVMSEVMIDLFIFILIHVGDMEEEKRLPKYVVFKGDNGKYLSAWTRGNHVYLQCYVNEEDKNNKDYYKKSCLNTIEYDKHGHIRIKSAFNDKFWYQGDSWIWPESSAPTSDDWNDPRTLFQMFKITEGRYALKNLQNGKYISGYTENDRKDCLNAYSRSIEDAKPLTVEEAVESRRIFNIKYHTDEVGAKNCIKERRITLTSTEGVTNKGSEKVTQKLTFEYELFHRSTWQSSASMEFGLKAKAEAGIPKFFGAKAECELNINASYNWGETKEVKKVITREYTVLVPPGKKASVTVVATEESCEVPFSYTQEDTLYTKEVVRNEFHDGIYRGVYCYGADVQIRDVDV